MWGRKIGCEQGSWEAEIWVEQGSGCLNRLIRVLRHWETISKGVQEVCQAHWAMRIYRIILCMGVHGRFWPVFDGFCAETAIVGFKSASLKLTVIVGFGELGVIGLVAVLVSFRFVCHTQTIHDFDQIIFLCRFVHLIHT